MRNDLNIYYDLIIYEREIKTAIRCYKILNGIDTRTQVLVENVDFNSLIRDGLKKIDAIISVSKNDPEVKKLKEIVKCTKTRYQRNGDSVIHRIHRIGFYPILIEKNTATAEQYFDCDFEVFIIACFVWNMKNIEQGYQKKLKENKATSREKAKEVAENIESQNLPKIRKGKQQIEEEKRALLGEIEDLKSIKTTLENEIELARIEYKKIKEDINDCQFETWQSLKNLEGMSNLLLQLCLDIDTVKALLITQNGHDFLKEFEVKMIKRVISAKKMRGLDYTKQTLRLNSLLE